MFSDSTTRKKFSLTEDSSSSLNQGSNRLHLATASRVANQDELFKQTNSKKRNILTAIQSTANPHAIWRSKTRANEEFSRTNPTDRDHSLPGSGCDVIGIC
jgi:hypothetical protein